MDIDVLEAFGVLSASLPGPGELSVRETGCSSGGREVLLGVDSKGYLRVLIPVGSDDELTSRLISSGIELRVSGDDGARFADLLCTRNHLAGVFAVVVGGLLRALSGARSPVATIDEVLDSWQELFARPWSSILSAERLAGVVGELVALRELAARGSASASWWTGPLGHVHDIVAPGYALEVKSTLRRDDYSVVVNGLGQLAGLSERKLHLFHVRMLQDDAGSVTLPTLVAELGNAGLDTRELMDRAAQAGADPRDYEEYSRVAFQVVAFDLYDTDYPGFPRLTEGDIGGHPPPGVSHIRYVVDLNVAPQARIDTEGVDELLSEIVNQS